MRLLFEMDKGDHSGCTHSFIRNSARSIIIRDGKVAMVHSLKYDYYKFPGGGIESGEHPVREFGYVHRVQKSDHDDTERFVQNNFYYLCETEENQVPQNLDAYEAEESFRLEYVDPEAVIRKNRSVKDSPYNGIMFEREARILELLQSEGILA